MQNFSLSDEVKECMLRGLEAVNLACASKDPDAIDAATVKLNKATKAAINAVYCSVPAGKDSLPAAPGYRRPSRTFSAVAEDTQSPYSDHAWPRSRPVRYLTVIYPAGMGAPGRRGNQGCPG